MGGIINPLTASGTILANGVVASVYPEWISKHMLSSKLYPLPLSACNLLTYLFPAPAQTFYDAVLEPRSSTPADCCAMIRCRVARTRQLHVSDVVHTQGCVTMSA